jgi:hypothetical protein
LWREAQKGEATDTIGLIDELVKAMRVRQHAQWRLIADQIRPKVPKLAALMDEPETGVLAYMTFPA